MISDVDEAAQGKMPLWARVLGFAGLIPQALLATALVAAPPRFHPAAGTLSLGYAALILSFVGGAWWGMASRSRRAHPMVWVAAVLPSLIAFAALGSSAITASFDAGLIVTGIALVGTLIVDRMLAARRISPVGWLDMRMPLSIGLGSLTVLIAFLV